MSRHDEIMDLATDAADIRSSDTAEFYAGRRVSDRNYKAALAALSAAVAELVRDAELCAWQPYATRPKGDHESYLITNGRQVAPLVCGVIQNNPGTLWDWDYGSWLTGWMPLPTPPALPPTHHTDKQEPQ